MLMSIEIDKSRYKSIASPENFVIIDFYRQIKLINRQFIDNYRALSTYRLAFQGSISIDMLRPVSPDSVIIREMDVTNVHGK